MTSKIPFTFLQSDFNNIWNMEWGDTIDLPHLQIYIETAIIYPEFSGLTFIKSKHTGIVKTHFQHPFYWKTHCYAIIESCNYSHQTSYCLSLKIMIMKSKILYYLCFFCLFSTNHLQILICRSYMLDFLY